MIFLIEHRKVPNTYLSLKPEMRVMDQIYTAAMQKFSLAVLQY